MTTTPDKIDFDNETPTQFALLKKIVLAFTVEHPDMPMEQAGELILTVYSNLSEQYGALAREAMAGSDRAHGRPQTQTIEDMIKVAQNDTAVMAEVLAGRKIQAIKELRRATNQGLKEAKDAIEELNIRMFGPGGKAPGT